ncbi:MAG: glycerate kinase [Chthoniobacterales bacterium]
MRILVAPDKFKDSLGAAAVAEQIAAGVREVFPRAEIIQLPLADGGEGTAAVICAAAGGEWQTCDADDARGRPIVARYCTIDGGEIAIMEMSEAAGRWREPENGRDPVAASSSGVGKMLLEAARRGAREIVIGLGGSATNDGGFGLARALGFRFLDENGVELAGDVLGLLRLREIRPGPRVLPRITAAADVRNPLLGDRGATRTFGAQKGATVAQTELLEAALKNLADVCAEDFGKDFRETPGAGAAGGLGFGLLSFCSAEMRSGFEVVAERIGLEEAIQNADLVITGEGRLDGQTREGKAPAGVARLARRYGKQVCAIVGSADDSVNAHELFDAVVVLARPPVSVAESISCAPELLRARAAELARGDAWRPRHTSTPRS